MHAKQWILGGAAALAVAIPVTVAAWPDSAKDTAYDDGYRIGESVTALHDADTYYEVDDALTEVRHAVRDAQRNAQDELDAQITTQGDNLSQALNGFAGVQTTTDDWDEALYQDELDSAVDAMSTQADDFRTNAPEVTQAFYDGLQDGLES